MKPLLPHWSVVLAGLCLFRPGVEAAAGQPPDPLALLRGVEQAREPLHGKMRIAVAQKRYEPYQGEGTAELEVEFDRDQRRMIQHQTVLMTSAGNTKGQRRLEALKGNIQAAAAEGIGTLEQVRVRSVYDGNRFATYSEKGGAYIHDPNLGSVHYCFDPRILGIARRHSIGYTLEHCLGLTPGSVPTLVGREMVDDRLLWHVKVASPKSEVEYHFWLEDEQGFRVHRYEYRWPNDGSMILVVTRSEYSGRNRPILPSRVVQTERDNGRLRDETVFTIEEADYRAKPNPAVFGFKGLEMPVGSMVIDNRLRRIVGYWSGEDVIPDYLRAKEIGAGIAATEEAAARRGAMLRTSSIVAGVALVVLVGSIVAYRRLTRRRLA